MESTEFYAPDVYNSLTSAVSDALTYIRSEVERGGYIGTHLNYPTFSHFESGVPYLSTTIGNSGPVEYAAALRASSILKRPKPEFDSWEAAVKTLESNERLREYHRWDDTGESALFHPRSTIEALIGQLAERYIHVADTMEFKEEEFRPIYREWETGVFLPRLPFDILVPIIFVDFHLDHVSSTSEAYSIERMTRPLQLARGGSLRYTNVANALVAGGASHALVLRNWSIENARWWDVINVLGSAEAFSPVIPLIERFFAALRVQVACETGYSQIVVRPIGWALRWTAGLPSVSTFTVREYPDRFDAHGWLHPPTPVDSVEAQAVVDLCEALAAVEENKLTFACNRLNRSYLRRDEADSILDLTIAMETLLADDTKSELAYRLAMRMGALAGSFSFGGYSPDTVFSLCKKVYDYRSSVVHGSRGSEKKRMIRENPQAKPIPAITIGLNLLRYTIKALATDPALLEVREVDRLLLRSNE